MKVILTHRVLASLASDAWLLRSNGGGGGAKRSLPAPKPSRSEPGRNRSDDVLSEKITLNKCYRKMTWHRNVEMPSAYRYFVNVYKQSVTEFINADQLL